MGGPPIQPMARARKLIASICLGLCVAVAALAWSEARSAAIYARDDSRAAKRDAKAWTAKVEAEFNLHQSTLTRLTAFALAGVLLASTALIVLWLPSGDGVPVVNAGMDPTAEKPKQ
jgi:hypothetical protein